MPWRGVVARPLIGPCWLMLRLTWSVDTALGIGQAPVSDDVNVGDTVAKMTRPEFNSLRKK